MQHSSLVTKYLATLKQVSADKQMSVLDLACGSGRNGLYLVDKSLPVTFADVNEKALAEVKLSLSGLNPNKQKLAQCWHVDFEQADSTPLQSKQYGAVMVFRYLHRPLFEQIKTTIQPGGLIIYETFTEQQAQFGRPKNPDFLLKPAELLEQFVGWQILHSFEGVIDATNNTKQAIAQIVAVKLN